MERESLYAAICADPRDDLPKLVFADWLDEHGDEVDRAHAELIRMQCDIETNARQYTRAVEPYSFGFPTDPLRDPDPIAKYDPAAGRLIRMLRRAAELTVVTGGVPAMAPPRFSGVGYRDFEPVKGLYTSVEIAVMHDPERDWAALARMLPVRYLSLQFASAETAYNIYGLIELTARVESLRVFGVRGLEFLEKLPPDVARRLPALDMVSAGAGRFAGPPVSIADSIGRCESLEDLSIGDLGRRWIPAFRLAQPYLLVNLQFSPYPGQYDAAYLTMQFEPSANNRLEELKLERGRGLDVLAARIKSTPELFPKLAKLEWTESDLTGRGATDLLTTAHLPMLRHLDVSRGQITEFIGLGLERTESFPRLHTLNIAYNSILPTALAALVRWPGYEHLRKLDLEGNPLNHEGIAALASADSAGLLTLCLRNCNLHGSHIRELTQSRFARSLWNLDLRGNPVDDAFIRALVETPFLDELQCLLLDLPEDDPGYDRLKARFGDRFQSQ